MSEIIDPLVLEWAQRTADIKAEIRTAAREYERKAAGERAIRTLWPEPLATADAMREDLATLPERLASVAVALRQSGSACDTVYEVAVRLGAAKIVLPGHDYVVTVLVRSKWDIDGGNPHAAGRVAGKAVDMLYGFSADNPRPGVTLTRAEDPVPPTVAAVLAPAIEGDDDDDDDDN